MIEWSPNPNTNLFHGAKQVISITYPFMQLRQRLQDLIQWKRTRKADESIPHYSISKPTKRARFPNELLAEIIHYLHDDRATLYQLSLVSWETRSIAQPLLFSKIDGIGEMSSRAYIRFLRCRRKAYRHVLLYVRSLTIDLPLRNRPCLNNKLLLLSMSKVTHLTLNLPSRKQKMRSMLQHCSEAFRLEEFTLTCEGIPDAADTLIITNFISEQESLKRLTIHLNPLTYIHFKPEALPQLEALCAGWMQVRNILPDRPLIKTVAIDEAGEWYPYVCVDPAMGRRLSHLLSLSVDIRTLVRLGMGNFLQDLELLEITNTCGIFANCRADGLYQRLLPSTKLKILILNSVKPSARNWDSKRLARDLFLGYPSLEKVVLWEVDSEERFFR